MLMAVFLTRAAIGPPRSASVYRARDHDQEIHPLLALLPAARLSDTLFSLPNLFVGWERDASFRCDLPHAHSHA